MGSGHPGLPIAVMSTNLGQLPPPENDRDFEALCLDVIQVVLEDRGAQAYGRSGQQQHGVDLLAHYQGAPVGVQCKHKDLRAATTRDPKKPRAELIAELRAEVEKAKGFQGTLRKLIFATSAPTDAQVQDEAERLRAAHQRAGLFAVEVWFWEKIRTEIVSSARLQNLILRKYYRGLLDALDPGFQSLDDILPSLRGYLEKLAEDCRLVPLLALDPRAGDVTDATTPELAKVYIHLNTTEQKARPTESREKPRRAQPDPGMVRTMERETEPLPALEALLAGLRTVFLGAPGSGKSTLFRYLAFCLAQHHLEPSGPWLKDLPGDAWSSLQPIPVWVELRRLAASSQTQPPPSGDSCHIWDFLVEGLKKKNLESALPALRAALEGGHALVLLDGLDEVPDGLRGFVREAIESFATGGFRKSRLVATCRVKSYQLRGLRLKDFHDFTLAEFTAEQSRRFVELWYRECATKGRMTPEDAAQCIPSLLGALSNPHLEEMARNPMHLTAMACLHTARAGQPLPEESAKLYDLLVNTLLFLWDRAKLKGGGEAPEAADELGRLLQQAACSTERLRETLERLAFQAHQGGVREAAGAWQAAAITQDQLKLELAKLHPAESGKWAESVIEAIRHRAGLLQSEDGKTFQFTFRFEEFLAGAYLANEDAWEHRSTDGPEPTFAGRAAALFEPTGYWRNVILWAAGLKAHVHKGQKRDVRDLIDELCQPVPSAAFARRRLAFAAEIAREVRVRALLELRFGSDTLQKLRTSLLAWVAPTEAHLDCPLKERAEMASQLGWVQDPRAGVGTRPRPGRKDVPDLAWARTIEPGDFIMGWKEDRAGQLQFKPHLAHPFKVAVYPVTVAQYELFIQDDGYERQFHRDDPAKRIWTEAGWQWREQNHRAGPENYESVFQTPNHPRVGVSWYEAMAFCNWLNLAFTSEELKLPDPAWKVRLPTEAEWERAARHTDGREFPWDSKDKAEPSTRCNCWETGLGATSAVGLFDSGKSVCEAYDLAGNVWEWCLTQWRGDYRDYETKADQVSEGGGARVLRGGSWNCPADSARCACRLRLNPVNRLGGSGFRLVASPFFPLNSETSEL